MVGRDAEALASICAEVRGLLGDADAERIRIRVGDVSVDLHRAPRTGGAAGSPDGPPDGPDAVVTGDGTEGDDTARGLAHVVAPSVGTFYHAPAPGEPPFVRRGEYVEAGRQVGVLEAMKFMTPVTAPVAGIVEDVLVGDGEPVEHDQQLIALAVSRDGVVNG